MRVILLGKEKHFTQPFFQRALEIGNNRGHQVDLWDKKHFLTSDIDEVDIVCLKSHFDVAAVWEKIETTEITAVNGRISSQHCLDRSHLDKLLKSNGILTPNSASVPSAVAALTYPLMQKPVDAGDHHVCQLTEEPATIDCARYFYQEVIPSAGPVYKLYGMGKELFMTLESDHGDRVKVSLPHQLHHLGKQISAVTGLSIYGADFLYHKGVYWLIDVNPFPGFREIPEAYDALWDYLETVGERPIIPTQTTSTWVDRS